MKLEHVDPKRKVSKTSQTTVEEIEKKKLIILKMR